MKKNELTDKHYGKGSKGFYAALGISAVMIGAACLFAHKQGDKLPEIRPSAEKAPIVQDAQVNRPVTDIPKVTAPAYRVTTQTVTAPVFSDEPQVTIPAADIIADVPPGQEHGFAEQPAAAVENMSGAGAPLKEMSNVLTPFSGGELVKNETTGTWQTHNGTDIAAEVGTDVYATESGEITAVTKDPLWGVTVLIDHKNGFTTKYCGLGSDLAVQQGDTVTTGDLIGAVGETADIESSVQSHLHIEITHNGDFIDPMTVLSTQ
ncbi:M23 family metallopeptidase [uncultured Ruminococcus sp.]|uniref:M23 family metallopeptidase n=1 Tax=uncultured Ruminococcus sp. TaxID=165186 RepID=UPI002638A157|nr:M23 family metallopeptidase [uncultured Ruminococcus sp.]